MKPLAIGIDLGTTNSAIAYINATGRPEVVPNREGSPITPSVIDFSCDPPRVGEEAKESQGLGEESIASFFKRSMGDPNFVLQLGGQPRTPIDLSALILKKLKEDAEAKLGTSITQAVITVPAYFLNGQREATIEAGRRAGLEVLRIINEPTAAALAFGLHESKTTQRVLVYDLGGGTFDVSLVEITPDNISVRATDGDHNLGGKDWDDRIAVYLGQSFAEAHAVNPLDNNVSFNDLLVRAEDAKKQLSSRNSTRVAIHYDGQREAYELTREKFQELTQDLMERTQCLAEQVLVEAGMKWTDLTGVLLVGGSTRMPMVHDYVRQMSGKEPMTGVNVDEAVALGAAIQAAIDLREKSGGKQETFFLGGSRRIQDVMSHSLGVIALSEDRKSCINSIIIPKNTPVPCSASKPYQLRTREGQDNQLDVYLLQGEQEIAHCCILGKYVFSGIAHVRGQAIVEIEYGYDHSGVVTVTATEQATGKVLPFTIQAVPADMSWLSAIDGGGSSRGLSAYTLHAGQQRIPGAITDRFGNAEGSQYDLAEDHAFDGWLIAVLRLCAVDFHLPAAALAEKGFRVHIWDHAPDVREFRKVLDDACQLWLISDQRQQLHEDHLKAIRDYFDSGKGLFIWGDNEPLYADANFVLGPLFECHMSGCVQGEQVVGLQSTSGKAGFVSHLITTGVERLYEGHTIATISANRSLEPLMYGSANNLVVAIHDRDGRLGTG